MEVGVPMEVGAARFPGVHGAEYAFADARDREPTADWLAHSAFAEVHRHGRIVVRGNVAGHYVDVDEAGDPMGHDTAVGAIVGLFLGLPLGPPAFAVGLTGGATLGGLVEAGHIRKVKGPSFDAIRKQLPEGSSAIVVFSDGQRIRDMRDALARTAATFVHYRLDPEAEAELRSELAQAPEAQPPSAPAT